MDTVTTLRRRGINASAAIKVPCIAASTGDLTLSGEQTVDGIALVDGDRCFAKSQTDTTEIGIYKVSTGTWEREPDFDGAYDVVEGTIIPVSRGTANADTYWKVTNTGTITIGTTAITLQATTVLSSAILNDGSVKMIADFSPNVTDTYDLGTKTLQWADVVMSGDIVMAEKADHSVAPAAGYGQLWSKNDSPPLLVYTDDAGTDHRVSPAAVYADHTRVGNMYRWTADSERSNFQPETVITEATWESVGPTGSGADNIWTGMDNMPSNAKFMILHAYVTVTTSGTSTADLKIHATSGDVAVPVASFGVNNVLQLLFTSSESGDLGGMTDELYIPLGTDLIWKCYWDAVNDSAEVMTLYYNGFIIDDTP